MITRLVSIIYHRNLALTQLVCNLAVRSLLAFSCSLVLFLSRSCCENITCWRAIFIQFSVFPIGFYDISDENVAPIQPEFKKLRQDNLDGKMRDQVEAEERRKDKEKMKKRKESDLPGAVMQINK